MYTYIYIYKYIYIYIYIYSNTLQHIATHCHILQHPTTPYNTL